MKKIIFVFVLLTIFINTTLAQPRTENEEFIIHPDWNVRNSLMYVKEGIKSSGLYYSDKITSDNMRYLHVITKGYEIAYYYRDDKTTALRIFDKLMKLSKWTDYYQKQVTKWPNVWSKTGDYEFKFKNKETGNICYVNLLRDMDKKMLIIEIK